MSRSAARFEVTSSPPSRMRPDVGSSSPAIMRSVVVLPQPEGPSRQKNVPSAMVKVEPRTATNEPKDFCRLSTRISAMAPASIRELADDHEHHRAGKDGREGI